MGIEGVSSAVARGKNWGGGTQNRTPKVRATRGSGGMPPPENFEI